MSALPCPVADPFAAADQAYATITEFLRSEEAWQVKHSELERRRSRNVCACLAGIVPVPQGSPWQSLTESIPRAEDH
jgi:hypothetical protein